MSDPAPGGSGAAAPVVLDALGEAVLVADAGGRVTYLNPAGRRLLGVGLAAARGRPLCGLLGLEEGGDWRALLDVPRRVVGLPAAAGTVDALLSLQPIRAEDGTLAGGAAVLVDISAVAGPDPEDAGAERRFHSLLDAMSELVSVHGPDMEARYVAGRGFGSAAVADAIAVTVPHDELLAVRSQLPDELGSLFTEGEGVR